MKCKRLLSVILTIVLVVTAIKVPMNIFAADKDLTDYEISADGVLTGYKGTSENITIPSVVSKIGNGALSGNQKLVSVTIPDSVKVIESSAFSGDLNLTSVIFKDEKSLGASLSLGTYVFNETAVTKLTLPSHTKEIGENFFGGMSVLSYVVLDSDTVNFNTNACLSIEEGTYFPVVVNSGSDSEKSLKAASGYGSRMVARDKTKLTLDDDFGNFVVNSDYLLVGYKGNATTLNIPGDVKTLDGDQSGALKDLVNTETINIPPSVSLIGSSTFTGSSKLTEINFADAENPANASLSVKPYAFNGTQVKSLTFPTHTTDIGDNSCSGISTLQYVIVKSVKENVFDKSAFSNMPDGTYLPVLVNLNSPAAESLKNSWGYGSIMVARDINITPDEDYGNFAVNKDLLLVGYKGNATTLNIPGDVKILDGDQSGALKDLANVTTINIPASVLLIGSSTFTGSSKLTKINFADAENPADASLSVKPYAFNATNLKSLTFPTHTTDIGDNSCSGISTLQYVIVKSVKEDVFDKSAFSNMPDGTYLPVLVNLNSPAAESLINSWGYGSKMVARDINITPDEDYGNFAVNKDLLLVGYKGNATTLNIPGDVKTLDGDKSDGLKNLETATVINIPASVTVVGSSTFVGSNHLKEINFIWVDKDDVDSHTLEIKPWAFQGVGNDTDPDCSGIEEINLPNFKLILDDGVFGGMRNLKCITILSKNVEYNRDAFGFVNNVPVYFPKENINSQAFIDFTKVLDDGSYNIKAYGNGVYFRYLNDDGTPDYDQVDKEFVIDGEGSLYKYVGNGTEVVIPDEVKVIKKGAFKAPQESDPAYKITKITIPYTVEKIEECAFESTTNLRKVVFLNPPTGMESNYKLELMDYVFNGCEIENFSLPTHLTYFDHDALSGIKSISTIKFTSKNTKFHKDAFRFLPLYFRVTVTELSETYRNIKLTAEYGKRVVAVLDNQVNYNDFVVDAEGNLTKYIGSSQVVTIPENVKTIQNGAFTPEDKYDNNGNIIYRDPCHDITQIKIPCTVKEVGVSAVIGCESLVQVDFLDAPANKVDDYNITIDGFSLQGTGVKDANGNTTGGITEIYLPNYPVTLGYGAFGGITNLKGIVVKGRNITYDRWAFQFLSYVPVFFSKDNLDSQAYTDFVKLINCIDEEGNEVIEANGEHKTEHFIRGFGSCAYYRYLESNGRPDYSKITKDFIIDGDGNCTKYIGSDEVVTLPSEVKVVASGAFKPNDVYNENVLVKKDPCHDIKKIIIPYTVKELGTSMIEGCESLSDLEFLDAPEDQINDYVIKIDAFALQATGKRMDEKDKDGNNIYEGGITEVTLPNYPVTLDYGAFGGIRNLKGIIVKGRTINYIEVAKQAETDLPRTGAFNFLPCVPVFFSKSNRDSQAFIDFNKVFKDDQGNPHNYVESYGEGVFYLYLDDNGMPDYSTINPEFIVNGDGLLTKYTGHYSDLHIPSNVVEIADGMFSNRDELTRVVIPGTCKKFRNVIFANDKNLTEVVFNEGFETLGSWCFQGTGITELILPASLKRMESGSGCGLENAEYIAILSKDVDMDKHAFEFYAWNYNLPVIVPKGSRTAELLQTMGGYGKEGNNRFFMRYLSQGKPLKEFCIDYNGVLTKYNGAGENVIVPNGVTELAEAVFTDNQTLKSIVLPASLRRINNVCFNKSKNLTSVTFNEGLEDLGLWAFQETGITELTLPSTITTLKNGALCGMPNLKKVTIYSKEAVAENNCCFLNNKEQVPEINVVRGSRTEKAFGIVDNKNNCNFILRRIGEVLDPNFTISNNVLTAYNGTDENVTIPDDVTTIGKGAFLDNKTLKTIVISSTVKTIEDEAFKGCSALKEAKFSEGLETIGNWSFSETALTEIQIPSTVKFVKTGSFGKNSDLKDVYCFSYNLKLPSTLGGKGAFAECEDICIHAAQGSGASEFAEKSDKTGFTFESLQIAALGAFNADESKDVGVIFRTQLANENKITVDGTEYNIKLKGVVVIPSDILGTEELNYNTNGAVSQGITTTAINEEDYPEFEILLNNIPSKQKARDFTLRPYVIYEDENGKEAYCYGNPITRSLGDVKSYTEGNH